MAARCVLKAPPLCGHRRRAGAGRAPAPPSRFPRLAAPGKGRRGWTCRGACASHSGPALRDVRPLLGAPAADLAPHPPPRAATSWS